MLQLSDSTLRRQLTAQYRSTTAGRPPRCGPAPSCCRCSLAGRTAGELPGQAGSRPRAGGAAFHDSRESNSLLWPAAWRGARPVRQGCGDRGDRQDPRPRPQDRAPLCPRRHPRRGVPRHLLGVGWLSDVKDLFVELAASSLPLTKPRMRARRATCCWSEPSWQTGSPRGHRRLPLRTPACTGRVPWRRR